MISRGKELKNVLYKNYDLILKGKNVIISPFTADDKNAYVFYLIETEKRPEDDSTMQRMFNRILEHKNDKEEHAIRLIDNYSAIGYIALQHEENHEPEFGIVLLKEYQNKGLGPEAMRLYLNWLHQQYEIVRVYAWIKKNNIQSHKAFQKLGAVHFASMPDEEMQK